MDDMLDMKNLNLEDEGRAVYFSQQEPESFEAPEELNDEDREELEDRLGRSLRGISGLKKSRSKGDLEFNFLKSCI